jgi:peptidoglycan hydrolase-like protein with peptidoglycan-binding domain
MSSAEVAALQRALAAAGYNVSPTGYFGPVTLSCVRDLQRRAGLGVDGVVGPRTVQALDAALGIGSGGGNPSSGGAVAPAAGALALPQRPSGAESGSAFLARTSGMGRAQREAEIERALRSGNVPDFVRGLRAVSFVATDAALRPRAVTIRVLPDYLALGSDADFVRIPTNPLTAQRIADASGTSLPTRKIVDEVWRAADVRLSPIPLPAGPSMMTNAYTAEHHRRIEAARAGRPLGALTAGHKKDVVISNRLAASPGRVAIYGWHYLSGRPIQPLTTVHENTYADYSHGVRLVDATVLVDGVPRRLADVLRDPVLHPLLSDEGRMTVTRQPGA